MIVEINLPEVIEPRAAISKYWQRYIFFGTPSKNHRVNAIANNYMRLVEAAVVEYGLASVALRQVWSDSTSIGLPAMHRAIAHFEACVTDMHRAIRAYRSLRNHKDRDALSMYLADQKPLFVSDTIADQVRIVRDSIHHLEEKLNDGEIADGQFPVLIPDGTTQPHPVRVGQTLKIYDRLVIGSYQLTFANMATLLNEMSESAKRIGEFDPKQA